MTETREPTPLETVRLILQHPDNYELRLLYANQIREANPDAAWFVRSQVALSGTPKRVERMSRNVKPMTRVGMEAESTAAFRNGFVSGGLWNVHTAGYYDAENDDMDGEFTVKPAGAIGVNLVKFRGGFPEGLWVTPSFFDIPQIVAGWFTAYPITTVRFDQFGPVYDKSRNLYEFKIKTEAEYTRDGRERGLIPPALVRYLWDRNVEIASYSNVFKLACENWLSLVAVEYGRNLAGLDSICKLPFVGRCSNDMA